MASSSCTHAINNEHDVRVDSGGITFTFLPTIEEVLVNDSHYLLHANRHMLSSRLNLSTNVLTPSISVAMCPTLQEIPAHIGITAELSTWRNIWLHTSLGSFPTRACCISGNSFYLNCGWRQFSVIHQFRYGDLIILNYIGFGRFRVSSLTTPTDPHNPASIVRLW